MNELTEELSLLRKSDPDVALLLDMYEEIERVYRDMLNQGEWWEGKY